jgi:class 3 adenylate cyclase
MPFTQTNDITGTARCRTTLTGVGVDGTLRKVGWTTGQVSYVKTPRGHIAYRAGGDGPLDYMMVTGVLSNLDALPDEDTMEPDHPLASTVRLLSRLEGHARCIMFDRSGSGCSDPLPTGAELTLEDNVEDLVAVMDAVGSIEVVANGFRNGAAVAIAFAALHPDRCRAIVLADASASLRRRPGYELGLTDDEAAALEASRCAAWGTGATGETLTRRPSTAAERIRLAQIERSFATPGTIGTKIRAILDADVRHYLDAIRCPALIFRGRSSPFPDLEHARYLAERIDDSRLVEVEAGPFWWEDPDSTAADAWEEFITGLPPVRRTKRRLVTVMFTDIVGSTEKVASSGDAAWSRRLEVHDRCCSRALSRYEGEYVKSTGDGIMALFKSPSDALHCATELQRELARNDISVRIGLHAGEVELREQDVGGIAVHLAARVLAQAEPDTIFVTEVIPPLVEGTGATFVDRGLHTLKGIEAPQRLYSVVE